MFCTLVLLDNRDDPKNIVPMDLHARYPALADLRRKAQKRIPHFVWEFLNSGTGDERTLARNRTALDEVLFHPSILHGDFEPELSTSFLGQTYALPLGIAPVGMSGLIWPDAERLLAQAAARLGIPYSISNVAAAAPEDVAEVLGEHAWFQMYPPRDENIRHDMLNLARAAGFKIERAVVEAVGLCPNCQEAVP